MLARTIRTALVVILVLLVGVGAFVGVHAVRQHRADHPLPPVPPPAVLASATRSPPPSPTASPAPISPTSVSAALRGLLASAALGSRVLADVVDASTGAALYARSATTATSPASTAKLATAAAVLAVHAPTDRIATRVVAGAQPGQIVLVGGGDPTLTGAATGSTYAGAARIADLATALKGRRVTSILVDDSLFTGPTVSPAWDPGDAPSTYAAPITALMVDGARDAPGDGSRSATPDLAAGQALATRLGISVPVTRGVARAGATELASVQSAPYSTLVRQMLVDSDDVLADVLARQVALADHQPASFTGAALAARSVLRVLGVDIGGGLVDGSGLAASDRLSPATLVALLRLIVAQPRLADVLDGLPVAGWDGTLADRYAGTSAGRGLVRAKTGTLTSVSALAGLVHDRSGRLLAFSFVADRVGPSQADTDAAEAALDMVASALAAI